MTRMATSDVPVAGRGCSPMTATRSGTATMPPPTPKTALKSPATTPMSTSLNTGRILLPVLDERLAAFAAEPGSAAVILDVDGTLAPIVPRPEDARVPDSVRLELRKIAQRYALVA